MSDQTEQTSTEETNTNTVNQEPVSNNSVDNDSTEQDQTSAYTADINKSSNDKVDYINNLVGDNAKYKSEDELAKGYTNLEKHSKLLEEENRLFREKLESLEKQNKTVDDILEAINKPTGDYNMEQQDNNNSQDINEVVRKALEEKDKADNEKQLRLKAKDKILEAFENDQDKANEAMTNYIAGDPNKDRLVKDLSITDPEGLVRLIKREEVNSKEPSNNSPTSSKSMPNTSDPMADTGSVTWSKAKEVLLNDPKTYYGREFRQKLNNSIAKAEEMGINFYET